MKTALYKFYTFKINLAKIPNSDFNLKSGRSIKHAKSIVRLYRPMDRTKSNFHIPDLIQEFSELNDGLNLVS